MSRQQSLFSTVIILLIALYFFPILINHWIVTIAKAIPSAFTLGITTVLLYKALRYPRGTTFTFLGLAQLAALSYITYLLVINNTYWVIVPLMLSAIIAAPRFSRFLWNKLGVDKYYQ